MLRKFGSALLAELGACGGFDVANLAFHAHHPIGIGKTKRDTRRDIIELPA